MTAPRRAVLLAGTAALVALGALGACSDDETGSAEELCASIGDGRAFAATLEGFDPTDTDGALEQLRDARLELGELRTVAPSEVKDDLTIEIDYIQALIEAIEGVEGVEGGDPTAAVSAVRRTTEEHPDVQQAADRLKAWAETSC